MAKIRTTRSSQYPLVATFTFNFDDTMVDVNGATKDFKTVGSAVFDAIYLPTNAVVLGGEVVTETAAAGSTAYNISVGDSGNATRYLSATDRTAVGRTVLVPTGYVGAGENIRVTVNPTVAAATAGKFTVSVNYVIRGRANETQTH